MSRLTRDGTVESVSRDQILRRERGQGTSNFLRSADHDHSRIGSLTRLIHTLDAICVAIQYIDVCMYGHTYIHIHNTAGTFNMPTPYQQCVWERKAHINWSMVTCQGSTRSEVP